jgi:hypothetical protein
VITSKQSYSWTLDRDPPYPPDLEITSGIDPVDEPKYFGARYRYWVQVRGGVFSQRIELMVQIEDWLMENNFDFEGSNGRYYFTKPEDVTMLLLRWAR